MTTIKSYSDLQQSKKLAEILPLESADMFVFYVGDRTVIRINDNIEDYKKWGPTPIWSLAALLSVLPNNEHIETTISRGSWKIDTVEYLPNTWWCEYEDEEGDKEISISADNPVDACYEMIIRLNELNLL